ncbi:hypothetical protein F0562_033017 [Nyssa sinensis]|uniref:Uncharacterized protein n=1 Tax=Nyssa sinensis TaxID=561372 RepID=A0A5J5ASQ4_9ASTE|nr:hypothetical protein F0562_033017 [Nyssa sinensis]
MEILETRKRENRGNFGGISVLEVSEPPESPLPYLEPGSDAEAAAVDEDEEMKMHSNNLSSPGLKMNNKKEEGSTLGKVIGAVAGIAVAAWSLSSLLSGSEAESNEKMMKAPGRDGYIPRSDFEKNPKDYFSNLRNSK